MKLTTAEFLALGKLMEFEIASSFDKTRLPVALPATIAKRLVDKGLVQEIETTLPGRFPVTIKYHAFTAVGHMTYCMECSEIEEEPCPST